MSTAKVDPYFHSGGLWSFESSGWLVVLAGGKQLENTQGGRIMSIKQAAALHTQEIFRSIQDEVGILVLP